MNYRVNDTVEVIAGSEKGKRGRILKVLPAKERVVIEKVNFVKRHTKPSQQSRQGGIVEKEGAIHVSNVALLNPVTGKGDRVGIRTLDDGRKVRFYKSTGEVVDV